MGYYPDLYRAWKGMGTINHSGLRRLMLEAAAYGANYSDVNKAIQSHQMLGFGMVLADALREVASKRECWPAELEKQI